MKPFTDILRELNGGKFAEEVTEAFSELIASCHSTGKAGAITVQLKLVPGKGGSGSMAVEHDFKLKEPDFDRPTDYLFVANGNTLVREHPNQQRLPFREVVDSETGEIKTINPAQAA